MHRPKSQGRFLAHKPILARALAIIGLWGGGGLRQLIKSYRNPSPSVRIISDADFCFLGTGFKKLKADFYNFLMIFSLKNKAKYQFLNLSKQPQFLHLGHWARDN
jgi:hypothetical protein